MFLSSAYQHTPKLPSLLCTHAHTLPSSPDNLDGLTTVPAASHSGQITGRQQKELSTGEPYHHLLTIWREISRTGGIP